LLNASDWSAKWIGYTNRIETNLPKATYWRKEIGLTKQIVRAMVYASALGAYELHINGKRVGEDYLSPVGLISAKGSIIILMM